jgi:hypothetical protein
MAYTPLGDTSNSAFENPSIAASNDGTTWVTPAGLVNPIAAKPVPAADYNSDVNLLLSGGILYCIWRERITAGPDAVIYYASSSNGINWSAKTMMVDSATGADFVCPVVLQTPTGFEMYALDGTPSPDLIRRYTATALVGPWTLVGTISITGKPTGHLWHYSVRKVGNQWVLFFVNAGNEGGGIPGAAWLATSPDGLTFTCTTRPLAYSTIADNADQAIYKPDFVPFYRDGQWQGRIFLSWLHGFNTGLAKFGLETPASKRTRIAAEVLANKIPTRVADLADRVTFGNPITTGTRTWLVSSGAWEIVTNKLKPTAYANNRATLDGGLVNCRVMVHVAAFDPTLATQVFLNLRVSADATTFLRWGRINSTTLKCSIYAPGATDLVTVSNVDWTDGDWISAELEGDAIRLFYRDCHLATVTSAQNNTSTKHGIQSTYPLTLIDLFAIEPL